MLEVNPINTQYNVNTHLGKRVNLKVVEGEVNSLVTQLLKSNPNISNDQIRVEVNNYLQTLEKNGTKLGKSRVLLLGNLDQTIKNCQPKPIVPTPVVTPKVTVPAAPVMPVENIPAETLRAYSPITEVSTPSRKEIKRMERLDRQLGGGLAEVTPQGISEQEKWIAEEAKKPVVEQTKSNKQLKKEANAEYVSSKKKKIAKKQQEAASRAEHRAARLNNTRAARNAEYCTRNGIISSEVKGAKEAFNNATRASENTASLWQRDLAARTDQTIRNSARDSAQAFMDNGFEPIVNQSKPNQSHRARRGASYGGGSSGYRSSSVGGARASAGTSASSSAVRNSVVTEVKQEIKTVIKEVPKTNPWVIAGSMVLGGILTWCGLEILANNKTAQKTA